MEVHGVTRNSIKEVLFVEEGSIGQGEFELVFCTICAVFFITVQKDGVVWLFLLLPLADKKCRDTRQPGPTVQ